MPGRFWVGGVREMTKSCERTRVWCFSCEAEHPGEIFVEDDEARCRVECPSAPGKVFRLSSDAEMFFRFRSFPSQAKSSKTVAMNMAGVDA